MRDWESFNAGVIAEFRSNSGVVTRFGGLPLVIVHTIGARSGTVREIPLIPVLEDDRMLLFGTAEGAPVDPAWCFNLRAHPVVDVEFETERFAAGVVELASDEASAIVRRRAEATPQLAEYITRAAPRAIPVFELLRR